MRTEHFFIVNPDRKFYRDYSDYLENRKLVNAKIKEFFKTAGIETKEYYCSEKALHIVPTEADALKFASQLCEICAGTRNNDGLRRFKKRSEINQAWVAFIAGTRIIDRPYMFIYFDGLHGSSYLFFDGDILYCSGEMDEGTPVPAGLTEIKGSEFYAVIEKMETSNKVMGA